MGQLTEDILNRASAAPNAEALVFMRLSLLDWLACGIAGAHEPVARISRDMVLAEAGAGQAALFGGGRAPLRGAALVNGAASHALDYDDTHFAHIGHPSVAILPAAMAVAEAEGATLDALVAAALAGCEASIRVGIALGRAHYQLGFHQTATAGAFGATVAAGQLMGLGPDQLTQAIGLVSTRASGLKSQFGTMGKPLNAGIAAANGVEAALLARAGFVSTPDGLDGPLGFLETHQADPAPQPDGWLMPTISHKFHACCHGLHAALEAIALLKPVDPAQVTRITIDTHPRWLSVCDKPAPQTGLEAKFSYRAVTALSLLGHDTAALDTYDTALCTNPQVTALRDRVRVRADAAVPETGSRVTLTLSDGTSRETAFDLDAPIALSDRTNRLRHKAKALLGAPRANILFDTIDTTTVADLVRHMSSSCP